MRFRLEFPIEIMGLDTTGTDSTIKYVNIQSLVDAHSIYIGQVSGKQYDWMRAGDIVPVREEDAPDLLLKRRLKKSCCGSGQNQIFQIAQGG